MRLKAMTESLLSVAVLLLSAGARPSRSSQETGPPDASNAKIIQKIVSGHEAPVGRFPYMCSLRQRGSRKHLCGGTVIFNYWVLTAAHCVDPNIEGSAGLSPVVYCGIHRVSANDPTKLFRTVAAKMHKKWKGDVARGYDIAVLKLDRAVNCAMPELSSSGLPLSVGQSLAATGWGTTEKTDVSSTLHVATRLLNMDRRKCEKRPKKVEKESWICSGGVGQDTCTGDSGGPLLVVDAPDGNLSAGLPFLDLVVGITSFGFSTKKHRACSGYTPGVYTSVAYFSEWIRDAVDSTPKILEAPKPVREAPKPLPEAPKPVREGALRTAVVTERSKAEDRLVEFYSGFPSVHLPREMAIAIRIDNPKKVLAILALGVGVNVTYVNATMHRYPLTRDSTFLHWAAAYNASRSATVLVENDAGLEIKNTAQLTPLHVAAIKGSTSVAEYLAEFADVDASKEDGLSVLHSAAFYDSVDIVKIVLEHGANPDPVRGNGLTPLLMAANNNRTEALKALLNGGADVNAQREDGLTALHAAALRGYKAIIIVHSQRVLSGEAQRVSLKALLDHDANINAVKTNGLTPLHVAANNNRTDAVKVLLERGADVDATRIDGWTALHSAALHGKVDIILVLLDNKANINAARINGLTPLHVAANNNRTAAVTVLLERGADVSATRVDGWTALHSAALHGKVDIIQVLLDHKANPDAARTNGWTPLHAAASNNRTGAVKALLDGGANIEATRRDGWTALHTASSEGYLFTVTALLDNGANPNAATRTRHTPLHVASDKHELEAEIVKVLIEKGADKNARNRTGWTKLHMAASHGDVEIVQVLLDLGADKRRKNREGDAPVDVVCKDSGAVCDDDTLDSLAELLSP